MIWKPWPRYSIVDDNEIDVPEALAAQGMKPLERMLAFAETSSHSAHARPQPVSISARIS